MRVVRDGIPGLCRRSRPGKAVPLDVVFALYLFYCVRLSTLMVPGGVLQVGAYMYALGDVSGAARRRDSAPFRNMAGKVTLRKHADFWLVVITRVLVWPSRAGSRQCRGTGYGSSFPSNMTRRSLLQQPQSL